MEPLTVTLTGLPPRPPEGAGLMEQVVWLLAALPVIVATVAWIVGRVREITGMLSAVVRGFLQFRRSPEQIMEELPDSIPEAERRRIAEAIIDKAKRNIQNTALGSSVEHKLQAYVDKVKNPPSKEEEEKERERSRGLLGLIAIGCTALVFWLTSCSPSEAYVRQDASRRRSIGDVYRYHLEHCPTYYGDHVNGQLVTITATASLREAGHAELDAWDRALRQAQGKGR